MNVIDAYEINHMRTAEMKSNEEWSSQLWTQFMQLGKKPEKNSGLLELCRSLRTNHGLLTLKLEQGGYLYYIFDTYIIFFGFAKLTEVVIY